MKQYISIVLVLLLVACTAGRAVAQPAFVRNIDLGSLGISEGFASPASVDDAGRVFMAATSNGLGDIGAALPLAPILVASDTAETGSTVTVINATAHSAAVGDYVQFTGGTAANIGLWRRVSEVATNTITVAAAFPTAPANTDGFSIYRARLNTAWINEDVAVGAGPLGLLIMGFNNRSMSSSPNQSAGDAMPFAAGDYGNQFISLFHDTTLSGAQTPIVLEDTSISESQAALLLAMRRIDTLSTNPGTNADASYLNGNSVGALYIDHSHAALAGTATAELAGTSLTTSYQTVLTNSAKLRRCVFNNGTDVAVSFDDGTNPIIERLPAGQIFVDEYAANGRWLGTNIRVKEVTNATSGQVSVNCYS